MMSRYRHVGLSADPLQRPRAAGFATSERHISSDALLDGLRSVAPRLGLVLLIAGALQIALRLTGH
ncbi:hypothetical protein GR212_08275 [Rhizobium lusitanum]|uniref:Uncharacterized protein n=1 Tax=Rhizobium lusitanum TaxID=293958 RepID=A0A6L9U305_9HYPH|nr:hypothetical protein [Rhizobium lusitanum]NEI69564.1 hypothetical protein [Rhizobium lusitanum]